MTICIRRQNQNIGFEPTHIIFRTDRQSGSVPGVTWRDNDHPHGTCVHGSRQTSRIQVGPHIGAGSSDRRLAGALIGAGEKYPPEPRSDEARPKAQKDCKEVIVFSFHDVRGSPGTNVRHSNDQDKPDNNS